MILYNHIIIVRHLIGVTFFLREGINDREESWTSTPCSYLFDVANRLPMICAKKSNWWRPKLGFKKTLPNALHWEAFALLSHGQVFHTNDSSLDRRGGLQELTAGTQLC